MATARLVSLVAAAVQLPILTRMLPPEEFGALSVAMAVATYFSLVTAEPAILAFQRHPGASDERGNYAFALPRIVAAVVIGGIVVVGLCLLWGAGEMALGVVAWGTSLALARYTATAWLMWSRAWSYSLNLIASTSARTIALVALVLVGAPGLTALIVAGLVSAAVSLVLAPRAPILRRQGEGRPWPRRLGYLLAAASLGVTLLTNVNVIVVEQKIGPAGTAPFAAMAQLAALSSGAVTSMVLTVLYPSFRRRWDSGRQEDVTKDLRRVELIMVAVGGTCIALLTAGDGFLSKIAVDASLVQPHVLATLVAAASLGAIGQVSGWLLQFRSQASRLARRTTAVAVAATLLMVGLVYVSRVDPLQAAAVATILGFAFYVLLLRGRRSASEPLVPAFVVAFLVVALIGPALPIGLTTGASGVVALVAVVCIKLDRGRVR